MSLTPFARRGVAGAFVACAAATLTLLANHPMVGARTIVGLIEAESRNQFVDGLVHGGFIIVLSVLVICFVLFARFLDSTRVGVVTGLVTFCVGCGALMASMLLDGFVIPAIATRFASTVDAGDLNTAKTLFILCDTLIRFLLPMGLLFQAAAMLSWSAVIVRTRGWRLAVGAFGGIAGALLIVSIFAVPPRLGQHVLLAAIALQSVWYVALAGVLHARNEWPHE
jgi:hypothetical protein